MRSAKAEGKDRPGWLGNPGEQASHKGFDQPSVLVDAAPWNSKLVDDGDEHRRCSCLASPGELNLGVCQDPTCPSSPMA